MTLRHQAACRRVDAYVDALNGAKDELRLADIDSKGALSLDYRSNMTQREFEAAVEKCVEYIRAGDIFQVVISQRPSTRLMRASSTP